MSSLLATLALALGLAAGSSPDERIVCVPSEDGKGWDCGRGASAPAPRSLPREHSRPAPSAPPPYLMDPSRIPSVSGQSPGAAAFTPPAPAPEAEPASDPAPAAAPEPAPSPMPDPAPTPEPVITPAAEAAPLPAPAPVPEPAPMPEAPATPATESVAEPAPAAEPVPGPAPTAGPAAPRGAPELLSLPPGHYTIQLAGATSAAGFDALQQQLGLAAGETYAVRVRRDGGVWWLLLWRDFPDLASARAAATSLGSGYWPRRLAPLQAEVQAARTN